MYTLNWTSGKTLPFSSSSSLSITWICGGIFYTTNCEQYWPPNSEQFWKNYFLLILCPLPLEVTRSILVLLCSMSSYITIVCMKIPLFNVSTSNLNCGITAVSSLLGIAFENRVLSAKVKTWFLCHERRQVGAVRGNWTCQTGISCGLMHNSAQQNTDVSILICGVLPCLSHVLENALENGAGESVIMPFKQI